MTNIERIKKVICDAIETYQKTLDTEMQNSAKPGNPYTAGLQGQINGLKIALHIIEDFKGL